MRLMGAAQSLQMSQECAGPPQPAPADQWHQLGLVLLAGQSALLGLLALEARQHLLPQAHLLGQ